MNKESNGYIFGFASVMVILVAATLAAAALLLKPMQDQNVAVDKMVGILQAANLEEANSTNALQLYKEYVKKEILLDKDGNEVSLYANGKFEKGQERAFDTDLKAQLALKERGQAYSIPLYELDIKGNIIYIIPVLGKGLWGPIWGNIALGGDLDKVVGATFDHKSETPGLGAQIADRPFQKQFIGKVIFEKGKFVSIQAIKGGVKNQTPLIQEHSVDAISGGTLTSNGLTAMLQDCLINYVPFIKKQNPALFK